MCLDSLSVIVGSVGGCGELRASVLKAWTLLNVMVVAGAAFEMDSGTGTVRTNLWRRKKNDRHFLYECICKK